MEKRTVTLWHPVSFSEKWEKSKTIKLDVILPSWTHKRKVLKETPKEYDNFMNRLKRRHAIETGIVEKLYDLNEGITETFIKEGFVESLLQHGDTNIDPNQLMAYLNDNFDALEFVFDIVKSNRPITVSFIKELHQLITKHQDTAEGRDQFGNKMRIPLLKGKFKEWDNNPTRTDGTTFLYCPPLQVDSEMDNFISILDKMDTSIHPIIKAAWAHHAFTNIHPFQDGNGRIARLLASLILIKHDLFPFTVIRTDKVKYINALESADNGEPQALVDFFCETQKRNIEEALNMQAVISTSFEEVADILAEKIKNKKQKQSINRGKHRVDANRLELFEICKDALSKLTFELEFKFLDIAKIQIQTRDFTYGRSNPTYVLIEKYAETHKYNFNQNLPTANFTVLITMIEGSGINLSPYLRFDLLIPLHHYGNDDSTLAIGGIIEYILKGSNNNQNKILPLPIEPFTISLEMSSKEIESATDSIKEYLQHLITLTLAQIASEINE